jgi:hypothetical protein
LSTRESRLALGQASSSFLLVNQAGFILLAITASTISGANFLPHNFLRSQPSNCVAHSSNLPAGRKEAIANTRLSTSSSCSVILPADIFCSVFVSPCLSSENFCCAASSNSGASIAQATAPHIALGCILDSVSLDALTNLDVSDSGLLIFLLLNLAIKFFA